MLIYVNFIPSNWWTVCYGCWPLDKNSIPRIWSWYNCRSIWFKSTYKLQSSRTITVTINCSWFNKETINIPSFQSIYCIISIENSSSNHIKILIWRRYTNSVIYYRGPSSLICRSPLNCKCLSASLCSIFTK